MTASRLAARDSFAEDLSEPAPWVPSGRDAGNEGDLASVTPIETPKLRAVLQGLAAVLPSFDSDDVVELVDDLSTALESGGLRDLLGVLHAWQVTGEALSDAEVRDVLLGDVTAADFVDVQRPE